jgi:hypothetical protein
MIDRPDFSKMFDAQGNALVPSAPEQASGDDAPAASTQALVPSDPNAQNKPVDRARDLQTGQFTKAPVVDLGFDRQGNVIPSTNEHGLPAEIAKEMHQSADGYDAQLQMMQAAATKVLQDMPAGFAEHFETEGIKVKAFRTLKAYPHLDVYGLIDKVQPTLTLSEMAEAQSWIKGLKR